MAYVLAEEDSSEYARLLEAAEKAIATAIQPLAETEHGPVYAALDDPNADWCKAVLAILDERPIVRFDSK
jgi:histidinol phosphatase-like PHP family hydrolase